MYRPHEGTILFLFNVSAFHQRQDSELQYHGPVPSPSLCLEGNEFFVSGHLGVR